MKICIAISNDSIEIRISEGYRGWLGAEKTFVHLPRELTASPIGLFSKTFLEDRAEKICY